MKEHPKERGIRRPNAATIDAMLVTCSRCGRLHPPLTPLAFHPVCAACAVGRPRR